MRNALLLASLASVVIVQAVSAQAMPVWSAADQARLKKGEIIAGAAILVEDPDAMPLPRVAAESDMSPIEPVEPEPECDPRVIPQDYLADYFLSNPESYLIDPQRLLCMQESLDREGFLEYHADDSDVDVKMYLFDAQQEIPAPYSLQKLVSERYAGGQLIAVVFYFLGDPSRSQLAFGGEGASGMAASDVRKMLENAQMKAMEKSDFTAQVESFIVQLSIRLYWLEKELAESKAVAVAARSESTNHGGGAAGVGSNHGSSGAGGKAAGKEAGGALGRVKPFLLYLLVGLLGVFALCGALFIVWRMWKTNRTYHFPVMEVPRRLEANYAAGVGAVMAFHNKLGSPSRQRDQTPDYLTRI